MNLKIPTLLALGVIAAGCGGEEPGRLPLAPEPADVSVSVLGRAPAVLSLPAAVMSERSAEVATRVAGTVERVHVDLGARVRRGDPLVTLDGGDVDARVAAAQARETLAERTFTRIDNLARQGAASRQERDAAEAALEEARAGRREAEAQEAYSVVRAPFDGVVTARAVDAGDLASPGVPLVALVAPGALKVVADVPASLRSGVRQGMPLRVTGGAVTVEARVERVVPTLVGASRTFRLEALVPDAAGGLVAGAWARIELEDEDTGARWVPADAVVTRGQLTGVFTVESDTLRLRWIRLGRRRDDAIELLAGPRGAVTVVRRPDVGLWDGRPVGSVRQEAWDAAAEADADPTSTTEVDR